MIDDPHAKDREERNAKTRAALAGLGWLTLSVSQFVTIALAIFATIPLLLSLFLSVQFSHVLSGSMDPTFKTSDLVITRPALGGELQKGAIVGVTYGDTQYAHRVVAVAEDGTATTKGDNNNSTDIFHPSESDLWGVVIGVIPQPLATGVTLFTINTQWWADASAIVTSADWDSLDDLRPGAPWGFFGLSIAIFLAWWLVPDLISLAQRRAERRESDELAADEEEPQTDIDTATTTQEVASKRHQ